MDLTIKTPAATYSIDKALVKAGKRIRHASEDTVIDFWIAAADAYVEKRTNLALMEQTLVLRLRRVLPTIFLPRTAAANITHVKYTVDGSSEVTVAEEDRTQTVDRMVTRVDIPSLPCHWQRGTMEVEYAAGATSPEQVPFPLRQASYLLAAHWLTSREAAFMDPRIGDVSKKISFGVDGLVKEYRVPNGDTLNDDWS